MPEFVKYEDVSRVLLNAETDMMLPGAPGLQRKYSKKKEEYIKLRLVKLQKMNMFKQQYWESAQIAKKQTLNEEWCLSPRFSKQLTAFFTSFG